MAHHNGGASKDSRAPIMAEMLQYIREVRLKPSRSDAPRAYVLSQGGLNGPQYQRLLEGPAASVQQDKYIIKCFSLTQQ